MDDDLDFVANPPVDDIDWMVRLGRAAEDMTTDAIKEAWEGAEGLSRRAAMKAAHPGLLQCLADYLKGIVLERRKEAQRELALAHAA